MYHETIHNTLHQEIDRYTQTDSWHYLLKVRRARDRQFKRLYLYAKRTHGGSRVRVNWAA